MKITHLGRAYRVLLAVGVMISTAAVSADLACYNNYTDQADPWNTSCAAGGSCTIYETSPAPAFCESSTEWCVFCQMNDSYGNPCTTPATLTSTPGTCVLYNGVWTCQASGSPHTTSGSVIVPCSSGYDCEMCPENI